MQFFWQIKLKNKIDWNVLGELTACTSEHGDLSSTSYEEESKGQKYEDEESEGRRERFEQERSVNEEELELSTLIETEPLMAGESNGHIENKEKLTESRKCANIIQDSENQFITKRAMDTFLQKSILEGEREALIGEDLATKGVGEKLSTPVDNLDTTLHTRKISGLSGFAVNLSESTAISKTEEDNDDDLSAKNFLSFAWQVAQGMVSISEGNYSNLSKEKKF